MNVITQKLAEIIRKGERGKYDAPAPEGTIKELAKEFGFDKSTESSVSAEPGPEQDASNRN